MCTPGTPRSAAAAVMPGVSDTPGRPRGRAPRGWNDPPPCPGHGVEHIAGGRGWCDLCFTQLDL
eukprot:5298097-Prymnesium_polylepis.1